MNNSYIYVYRYPENINSHIKGEIFYIGQGTLNRIMAHSLGYDKNNKHKMNTINKIRLAGHEPIIEKIFENLYNDEANIIEKLLIDYYGRRDLKNGTLTNKTDGGCGACRYIHTEESRRKNSESHKGEKNPNYGKPRSEETKKKLSISNLGKHVFSENTKSHPNKKFVKQYSKDMIYIKTFNSIGNAGRETKIQQSNIIHVCKGIRKSAGGFIWRYA